MGRREGLGEERGGEKQVFRVKKLVGLPPQLELLAPFSLKSGHDNMSEQCNHIRMSIQQVRAHTQVWAQRHRQTVYTFSFV